MKYYKDRIKQEGLHFQDLWRSFYQPCERSHDNLYNSHNDLYNSHDGLSQIQETSKAPEN